ncbi:MAG TPA: ANTAR domain-containing protein [Iamia sp.]
MTASPLVIVLDRLIGRHGLAPSTAWGVLVRAAARKGTTVEELASRIVAGVPSETDDLVAEVAHLRVALESRDVIGQAKGILMERHGIGADEAFARLVTMSRSGNVRLREIAENLVELRADLPSPEGDRLLG